MGMSIDDAIKYYSNKNVVLTEEEAEANTIALNTMRKYQKIQEIIDDYEGEGWERIAVGEIREVIENGTTSD